MSAELLIHCRSYSQGSCATQVGLNLAARIGAQAHGIYVVSLYPAAFATPETVALTLTAANREFEEAGAASEFWRKQVAAAGVAGNWIVCEDDPIEALARAALLSDLLVMERPTLRPEAPTGWGLVSRTVFACSRPVLVVPDACKPNGCGARVLVAWNGSREAAHALQGALPVLRWADSIVVLDGSGSTPSPARRLVAPALGPWLSRHGLKAEVRAFESEPGKAGTAILEAAKASDADLIVMGAWGRSRLSELVLGGATRHVFTHSDRPLLVAH
jgi:nucleotide-binding universal stress UspA family protein